MSLWWVGKYIPDRNKFGCSRCWGFWSSSTPAGARIVKRCFLPALTRSPPWLILATRAGGRSSLSTEPGGVVRVAFTTTNRQTPAPPVPPRSETARRHDHHRRAERFGFSSRIGSSSWRGKPATRESYLTATYSALALVSSSPASPCGKGLYRWLGLGILAFCLGRVFGHRCSESQKDLPRAQFHGSRFCSARAGIHLQQIPGED